MAYVLALLAALANALSAIFQRIGVQNAPADTVMSMKLIRHAFSNAIWFLGLAMIGLGFLFQAFALAFGQLSSVQPIVTSELLFLVLILGVWFRYHLGWREWGGSLAAAGGLATFLVVSAPGDGGFVPNTHTWIVVFVVVSAASALCAGLGSTGPTVVFHLAAFFANQNSVDYPLVSEDVNSRGMLKLLEYCVISGNIERFVYTNTEGGAYGSDCTMPYREEEISLRLGSPYYVSKMAGEAYCWFYHNHYSLPVSVVRLFNSYGPGEVPGQYRNVIPNFIWWAMKGQPLPLTGNKAISRDFVFVNDIVEGILRSGFFPEATGTPINIATGQETFIYELAELINLKTSNPAGTRILQQRKWDTREKIIGNNEKCRRILQLAPAAMLDTGLDLTIAWFHKNRENIDRNAAFFPGLNPALDV